MKQALKRKIRRLTMDKGILSIKIMILGAVIFLFGCEFSDWNSAIPVLALLGGIIVMLAGLLMGNRNGKGADREL